MQNTAHIIAYYQHKTHQAVWGKAPFRDLATFTRAHDAYLIEHNKSVSAFVAAQAAS